MECDGALRISLESKGAVLLDMVFLRRRSSDACAERLGVAPQILSKLRELQPSLLRWGGTMTWSPNYRWKNFRGPRWARAPYDDVYNKATSAGWRLFEFMELAEELSAVPAVTFNNWETPGDMADLVEYAFGSPRAFWGSQRVADGRTAPYPKIIVEVGNEELVNH